MPDANAHRHPSVGDSAFVPQARDYGGQETPTYSDGPVLAN
jgi:hypothetical protein